MVNIDDKVKNPTSAFRCILFHDNVLQVDLTAQDLCSLDLNFFLCCLIFNFLKDNQYYKFRQKEVILNNSED